MDDVDAFLASLDQFSSPTIDAGIQREQQQQRTPAAPPSTTAADSSGSGQQPSPAAAPQASRRRPRDETISTQRHPQHQRNTAPTRRGPFPEVDYVSSSSSSASASEPAPTTRHGSSPRLWWCIRCLAENSDEMQSCALCHRRRQRVEGPRPPISASGPPTTAPPAGAAASVAAPTAAVPRSAAAVVAPPLSPPVNMGEHTGPNTNGHARGMEPLVVAGPGEISCPRCTFLNSSSRRTCEMCDGTLPSTTASSGASAAAAAAPAAPAVPPPPPRVYSIPTLIPSTYGAMALETGRTAVVNAAEKEQPPAMDADGLALAPSAAAAAVVPSVTLPGLGGGGGPRALATSTPTATQASPSSAWNVPSTAAPGGSQASSSASAPPAPPRVVLQGTTRETLLLSPVAVHQPDPETVSSSDSESESSDDESTGHDSDWESQSSALHDVADHRELVHFLETLQSVQFDDLPCAAVPASMQARGELRPFQLQALHWLLSQEQAVPSRDPHRLLTDSTNMRKTGGAVEQHGTSSFSARSATARREETLEVHRYNDAEEEWLLSDKPGATASRDDAMARTVRGGVFADYMGLGKTRTLVALCEAARAPRLDRVTGSLVESTATLIVCPTSLLTQWVEEIRRCVVRPPSAPPLRILVYYGARKRRQTLFQIAQSYDYVLTTYQTLCHEQSPILPPRLTGGVLASGGIISASGMAPHMTNVFDAPALYDELAEEERMDDATQPLSNGEAYDVNRHLQTEVGKLFLIRWARIILDEAHYIRNMRTRQSRACLKLTGVCKWAVTATPVQNSLNDLYPLLRFLEVPHFSVLSWWNDEIVRYYNVDPQHPRPVTALNILFRSILLRRTPDSVVNGQPILALPPKQITTRTVALSRVETQFYTAIHTKATEKLSALRQREAGTAHHLHSPLITFTTAFEMLVRCRQTCLHPYIVVAALRKCHRLPTTNAAVTTQTAGSAKAGAAPFSVSGTNPEAASLEAQRQREAAAQATARALDHFVQTVVLRKLRTMKASEFVQSLVAEIKNQRLESRECIICLDTVNRPAILPCAHVFCEECIKHALELRRRCPVCTRNTRAAEVLLVPVELLDPAQHAPSSAGGAAAATGSGEQGKESGTSKGVGPPPEVPLDLDLTNLANWDMQLSSKTQYLIDAIGGLPVDDKVVVFSTFLTYLRFAQHCLEQAGISCAIFSGAMTMKQKQVLLDRFREDSTTTPDAPRVLLATISSCGVGLNLTCANHCFIMEPSWNPGTEEQALNRIHRIGQTKPVTVTKLVADSTIEQNIRQLCERKRALSGYCFSSGPAGPGSGDGRLRTADLLQLFAPEISSDDDDSDEEESDATDSD